MRLAIGTADGRELSFQIAAVGDIIGEVAVLDGGPRSAEGTALTPVSAYVLERNALRELWGKYPAITDAMIAFLCWRLRGPRAASSRSGRAAPARGAPCALSAGCARHARGPRPGDACRSSSEFSQSRSLPNCSAASPAKSTGALGTLEQAGAIGRTADRLFCDRAKLEAIAKRDDE